MKKLAVILCTMLFLTACAKEPLAMTTVPAGTEMPVTVPSETEMEYPGQIKVNVIRESRAGRLCSHAGW